MSGHLFHHVPVLMEEVLAGLDPRPGGRMLDGTLGGGGHAAALLERLLPGGCLYGTDRDPAALEAARARLEEVAARHEAGAPSASPDAGPPPSPPPLPFALFRANFMDLGKLGLPPLDGVLLDLGVSSHQLDTPDRGFSFQRGGPLDMRMDPDGPETAAALVARLDERALADLIWRYGEDRASRRIARAIVERRAREPFRDTADLAAVIRKAAPAPPDAIHPATRSFQALRIAVNGELEAAEAGLRAAVEALAPGGRVAMISFHSLEDRIVKLAFRELAKGCICPPRQPMCTCARKPVLTLLTPRPVMASESELRCNPRARSARLRVAERLGASSPSLAPSERTG